MASGPKTESGDTPPKSMSWSKPGLALFFGIAFVAGGGFLLLSGMYSFSRFLTGLKTYGLSFLTSEVGLFMLGGAGLALIGLAILFLASRGVRVDFQSQRVSITRGVLRIPFRHLAFADIERVRAKRQAMGSQRGSWYRFELWLDIPPKPIKLDHDTDCDKICRQARELAHHTDRPFVDETD